MALTRDRKLELAKEYQQHIKDAKNVVVIKQKSIPVNEINQVRKDLFDKDGLYKVVKKRVLLKSLEDLKVDMIELETLEGSVAVLCAYEDEYEPLKVIHNHNTDYKKKKKEFGFEYVGGRFDGERKDSEFVSELASIPSKDELIAKMLYVIKYPLQGLAMSLNEVSKKAEGKGDMKVADLIDTKEKSEGSEQTKEVEKKESSVDVGKEDKESK